MPYFIFHTIGPTDLHSLPAPYFKTLHVFLIYFQSVQAYQYNKHRTTASAGCVAPAVTSRTVPSGLTLNKILPSANPRNRGSISDKCTGLFPALRVPTDSDGHPASQPTNTGAPSRRWIGRSVKLTTHHHLLPWLRMSGAISLSPPRHVYGVTFTFTLLTIYTYSSTPISISVWRQPPASAVTLTRVPIWILFKNGVYG